MSKSRMSFEIKSSSLLKSGFCAALIAAGVIAAFAPSASAQPQQGGSSPLIITDQPLPEGLRGNVYNKPFAVQDIKPQQVVGSDYFAPEDTLVTRKIDELRNELADLQSRVSGLSSQLTTLEAEGERRAAEYYAAVATVNTQLQTGTTPGNPRLLKRINAAEANLEDLASNISQLSQLAIDVAQVSSVASFLLEGTRATYGLSGAVEEDHVMLAELEDTVNNTIVIIERITNNVNDDITRASAYLSSERNNLRTLALAVNNGDLYGKSLANRPFSRVSPFITQASANTGADAAAGGYEMPPASVAPPGAKNSAAPGSAIEPRPLVKIRFDRPDVEYEQPLYVAVNETLERFPDAKFDLVAVQPSGGNAAQVAIESTRARRNAERVLRTLTQMGMPLERIDLSYSQSDEARSSEVHLYIR